jgi:spore maturation protein CgeB
MGGAGIDVAVYGKSPFEVYGGKRTPIPALRALFYWQEGWQRLFRSLSYKSGRECIRAGLMRSVEVLLRETPERHLQAPSISYHEGPSFADMPKVFARSALSLGSMESASTYVLQKPLMAIRFREFEAAMSGAAHLANDYPELKECYEEDREMIFYSGFDDLVDKVRFWLRPENDTARRAIRVAARRRSEAEHSWRARFRRCFAELGLAGDI